MTFKYICPKCGHENVREYPATRIVCDKCLCVFRPSGVATELAGRLIIDKSPLSLSENRADFKPISPTISNIERRILNRGPGC